MNKISDNFKSKLVKVLENKVRCSSLNDGMNYESLGICHFILSNIKLKDDVEQILKPAFYYKFSVAKKYVLHKYEYEMGFYEKLNHRKNVKMNYKQGNFFSEFEKFLDLVIFDDEREIVPYLHFNIGSFRKKRLRQYHQQKL